MAQAILDGHLTDRDWGASVAWTNDYLASKAVSVPTVSMLVTPAQSPPACIFQIVAPCTLVCDSKTSVIKLNVRENSKMACPGHMTSGP